MAKLEKDGKAKRELLEKIARICNRLSLWELLRIYLYIKRIDLSENWNKVVWNWLLFQVELSDQIKTFKK